MTHHRILSFKYAFEGLAVAFKKEPNFKIHLGLAILAVVGGWYFQLSTAEWLIVIVMIGLVLALELTNSAIEMVVDSFTTDIHPGAKFAKDVSAAAVLVIAVTAGIVGVVIFLPHVL